METTSVNSPNTPHESSNQPKSGAMQFILQSLTYVFWFWSLCLIGTTLSGVLIHIFIRPDADSTWILYAAAPLIILLPLASIADRYYKQVEPREKHGISAFLMVINAVIACLGAVGSMVAVVYAILNMLISTSTDFSDNVIACIVSLVIAALSTLFFIRVLYVERLVMIRNRFTHIVAGITAVTLLLVIVFPLVSEIRRKGDRIVEDNYSYIVNDISKYVRTNEGLPADLDKVDFGEEAQRAIDTGKVTYEPGNIPDPTPSIYNGIDLKSSQTIDDIAYPPYSSSNNSKNYTFELCVDWSFERENEYGDDYYSSTRKSFSGYYGHKKGKACYEETAYVY